MLSTLIRRIKVTDDDVAEAVYPSLAAEEETTTIVCGREERRASGPMALTMIE